MRESAFSKIVIVDRLSNTPLSSETAGFNSKKWIIIRVNRFCFIDHSIRQFSYDDKGLHEIQKFYFLSYPRDLLCDDIHQEMLFIEKFSEKDRLMRDAIIALKEEGEWCARSMAITPHQETDTPISCWSHFGKARIAFYYSDDKALKIFEFTS